MILGPRRASDRETLRELTIIGLKESGLSFTVERCDGGSIAWVNSEGDEKED
jgi:hypothetical protein